MANLKGSTFDKQIKNALCRLSATGESKHNSDGHKTHSVALGDKREMYLRDFKNYLENSGISSGKMNEYINTDTIKSFIEARTSDLAAKTALDYTTGFNSLLKGLEETNINIETKVHDVINEMTTNFREEFNAHKNDFTTGRAIHDREDFINQLQEIREGSALTAELQFQTGLRAGEAIEVANNIQDYYNPANSTISDVVGKGGQLYGDKEISPDLYQRIAEAGHIPAYSTYQADISQLDHTSHDLRISFAEEKYNEYREEYGHEEALKLTSKELNHHRPEITEYYLKRA